MSECGGVSHFIDCKKRVLFTTSAMYRIWKIWSAYGGVALHLDGDNAAVDMSTCCREQLYITRDHPVLSCVLVVAVNVRVLLS
jgi:hypothetical protein